MRIPVIRKNRKRKRAKKRKIKNLLFYCFKCFCSRLVRVQEQNNKTKGETKMYCVKCVSGSIEHVVLSEVSYAEARRFCDGNNWQYDWNGGLLWELCIEEE